ncbi:MAG: DUF799 family lipoprotein [Elusimicrobia bacterium]|nr:DUF799 family lipoprotein [Elusimicrobiota bacterium]
MPAIRLLASTLALLLCSGCGGPYIARFDRPLPSTPEQARRVEALSSVYVLVEPGEGASLKGPDGVLTSLGLSLQENASRRPEAAELGRALARALAGQGVGVTAWRVDGGGPDPFASALKPASVLRVSPERLGIGKTKTTVKRQRTDASGNTVEEESPTWHLTARFTVQARLVLAAGELEVDAFSESASAAKDSATDPDLSSWYREQRVLLAAAAARKIAARLARKTLRRKRPLFEKPGDRESQQATRLARQGRWGQAEKLWRARAARDGAGWTDTWALGVLAEKAGRDAEARALFEKARLQGEGAKELRRLDWAALLAELPTTVVEARPRDPDLSWFEPRVAVLPFSDETTSVDGPVLARQLVHAALAAGGHVVLPLAEVDERLRERGFTQGGQLKAAAPEKLARWLDAGRLVFGHIEYYQTLPAKAVSGELWLWDRQARARVWTAKSWAASEPFVGQDQELVKKASDLSWSRKLLMPTAETLRFARRAIGTLPQRP